MGFFDKPPFDTIIGKYRLSAVKSFAYDLAMNPDYEPLRNHIEELAANQAEQVLSRIRPRFKQRTSLEHTLNELALGSHLATIDPRVEFEPTFSYAGSLLTPDWLVTVAGKPILIEGTTKDPPDERRQYQDAQSHLISCLRDIKQSAIVGVSVNNLVISRKQNHEFCTALKEWLSDKSTSLGDEFKWNGYRARFLEQGKRQYCVGYVVGNAEWLVSDSIGQSILKKVQKYKHVVGVNALPYVIALSPGGGSGYSLEDLEDVLFGKLELVITFDKNTGETIQEHTQYAGGGFWERTIEWLSGILWFDRENKIVRYYSNPHATNPIADDALLLSPSSSPAAESQ